jgi:hypothetical protein
MDFRSPTLENRMEEFLKSFTNPEILTTFEHLDLKIFYKNEEINLPSIYGFLSIYDLKLAIYEYFKEDFAAPNNQFLYIDIPKVNNIDKLIIDFEWNARLLKPNIAFSVETPVNSEFVNSDGEKRIVDFNPYENVLIETKVKSSYKIQLIFFRDAYSYFTGIKPLSEKEFNGRFYPYFPFLKNNKVYPNESDKLYIQNRLELYKKKLNFINRTNELLENNNETLLQVKFAGIKYLSLNWPLKTLRDTIDILFYNIPVNEVRPYLRLLPIGTTPISKIHLKDISNNIPNIYQPQLLKQWTDERNPNDKDSLFFKIAIKTNILNVPYIYATTYLSNKNFFEVIIDPPKDVRKIDLEYDAPTLGIELLKGVSIINNKNEIPTIGKGKFIYGLSTHVNQIITKNIIQKRVQLLKPFFQEIDPLPNEQPLIMLRYKLVNNYVSEDNINTFLTLLSNKKIIKGETTIPDIIQLVSDEFQIDLQTVREKVTKWFTKKDEYQQIILGESKEFTPVNNYGVDIGIFQKKNLFSIHLYNITNIKSLQRIISLISLLFSLEDNQYKVSSNDVKQLVQSEEIVNKLEDVINDKEEEEEVELDELAFEEEGELDELTSSDLLENTEEKSPEEDLKNVKFEANKLVERKEVTDTEEIIEEKGLANFFIRKLQEADRSLFVFTPKSNTDKTYVQMCAANEMRQPAVLNQDQYDAMREEYTEDPVIFVEYTMESKGSSHFTDNEEYELITVLKYQGSNPRKDNYYLCSEYFCTKDEIVVLKRDFENKGSFRPPKIDGAGKEILKDFNRCPFCNGKIVENRKNPGKGENVLRRIPKPKTDKRHLWINFLKKTSHPDGLRLPCCFVKPQAITFEKTESKYIKKRKDIEDEEENGEEVGDVAKDYKWVISMIDKKYIIGVGEKYLPLEMNEKEGPQIGLLPKEINQLFQQDISKIVRLDKNPIKIQEYGAKGFLRIAVENRSRYRADSFLAAVAPFFNFRSAREMKNLIWGIVKTRVFVNINYGNLMLEFYNPDYKLPDVYKNNDNLIEFAYQELNADYNPYFNAQEIERILKSYLNFKEFLISEDQTKEYRQFALLFSQSGLLNKLKKGITFIVIDLLEDNSIKIRCPSYGYNSELMDNNDVGFLLHHYSGTWEPIFYIDNREEKGEKSPLFGFTFQKSSYDIWPPILKSLYGEFKKSCETSGYIVYTGQSRINANNLLPLSLVLRKESQIIDKYPEFSFDGIMRDSYNHVSGVVCRLEKKEKVNYFFLPVIDDGIMVTNKKLYLNIEELEFSNVSDTYFFYVKYIITYFPKAKLGYSPKQTIINEEKGLFGLQLENGLIIPLRQGSKPVSNLPNLGIDKDSKNIIDKSFQWKINRNIVFGSEEIRKAEKELESLTENNIEEIYQHLRITFGNYLAKKSSIKQKLEEDIIFKNLPLNEKRRRFIVLFGNEVLSWFSNEQAKAEVSFLRKDCTIQSKETCNDKCVFTDNKCKIHIPKEKNENIGYILMLRLFDEIIRYSEERAEIFNNEISKIVFLNKAVHVGDKKDEYIVPENTIEWSDLLRFSWLTKSYETPKYFEEIYTYDVKKDEKVLKDLPNEIKAYLNPEDPNTKTLKYYEISNEKNLLPMLEYLDISPERIKYNEESVYFNNVELVNIHQYLRKINKSIIQINAIDTSNIQISPILAKNPNTLKFYLLLITKDSFGFLIDNKKITLNYNELPSIISLSRT